MREDRGTHDDDMARETPPAVVGAVSVGTAPLPFLAVYAVLFLIHGTIAPAHPPAITSTQTGELISGIVAALIFIVLSLTLWLFLNGRLRWPFVVGQVAVLATTIWFLSDATTGGRPISLLLVITTVVALICGFAPDGWRHVRAGVPGRVTRLYRRPGGSSRSESPHGEREPLPQSGEPTLVEPSALRHRHESAG